MKIMTTSDIFGLNFLRPAAGGGSAPIVGDYDPRSQTWGGIVTAQSTGGCANECYNCCGNNTSTDDFTAERTNYTTYDATDLITNNPDGSTDYATDAERDSQWDTDLVAD
jgi:hypothetical protein